MTRAWRRSMMAATAAVTVPAVAAVLAGCATTVGGDPAAGGADEDAPAVEIEVQNNLSPQTPARIYAVVEGEDPEMLGTAAPGERTRLRLREDAVTRRVRLTARADGREIVSDAFVPSDVDRVAWNLTANELTRRSRVLEPG